MKKLSEFSVNHPITIWMIVLAILLLGYISFTELGMDLLPDLNNPRIFVELKAGERPPEEMERQFVEMIESIAIRQKKVIQVSSISRVGSAQITVEYSWNADMDEAFLDLQKSMTNFTQNSELEEVTLSQHDPNSEPVVLIGFSHPQIEDMDELRKIASNYLRNELTRIEGIAAVDIIGGEEKEVVIETSQYMLEAHGLTLAEIANRIQNSNISASGGSIVELGLKYIIKGIGEFQSLDDIGKVIVTTIPGESEADETQPVYLRDVATVSYANKESENIVRINQNRCIALAVYKETKYNTVKAVDQLMENLETLKRALPAYEFQIIQNQAKFINTAIEEVEETALLGIILAVIILFVFLRRIGTTLIISVAIPVSVIATFNLMYFNDLSLNIMTLGGLALGAGMLVDNAIVVMENIFRNIEAGLSVREASIKGTAQVAGAITASTVTTIIVFLPIVYLHGAAGELFKDQAWTVAFSLFSSLIVAILVIPVLSHLFLRNISVEDKTSAVHFNWYPILLRKIIDRRWSIILGALVTVIFTLIILPYVGSEFIPRTSSTDFQIEITLAEGAALPFTDRVVAKMEETIKTVVGENLESIYARIGPSSENLAGAAEAVLQDENSAFIHVFLKADKEHNSIKIIEELNSIFSQMPDMEIQFINEQSSLQSTLGTDQAPLMVEIKGDELETIGHLSRDVKEKMREIPAIFNIETPFDQGRPEMNIVIDRTRAGVYNLDFASIASQLQDQIQGRQAGDWESEGERRDITLYLPDMGVEELASLYVTNAQHKIRLDEIAKIEQSRTQKEIFRRNQVRIGRVTANIREGEALDLVSEQIEKVMQQIVLPPNYQYAITGEEEKRAESFSSLKFALLLSIVLIYMVLASQFESLVHPLTIIFTIPLAAVGAILIFFVLGIPLNVMAYIGIIMLVGIAVNDSIILVDAINQLKSEGFDILEAIVNAGSRRIRPIVMTSLTTILALFPLTLGFGESAALRAPLALAVIGGLITSTVLTLVVIPCVYYLLDSLVLKIRSK
jgi:HAE1 family hydrophobic/amphiphilic exporter-1